LICLAPYFFIVPESKQAHKMSFSYKPNEDQIINKILHSLNESKDTVKSNIERILLGKCGNEYETPTGHPDYYEIMLSNPTPIPPFIYDTDNDVVYMTNWEGGNYSIEYVTVPTLAGIKLWNINDPIEDGEWIDSCDYRNRGRVLVYTSRKGVRTALRARIERNIRRWIHRYQIRKLVASKTCDDLAKYVIMPFVK
jgi:hypothetical protein